MRITVYIVDDHQIIVDGIKQFIMNCEDMQFVGSATNGDIALQEMGRIKPDIVLTDLRVPGKTGLEITHAVKRSLESKVIILSMYAEVRYINDARKFGADAYLLKNADREELMDAIRRVHRGEKLFHEITVEDAETIVFTPREKDILRLMIQGLPTSEISEQLHLSPLTVATHRKNIMRKTDAGNVAGLIKFVNDHRIFVD